MHEIKKRKGTQLWEKRRIAKRCLRAMSRIFVYSHSSNNCRACFFPISHHTRKITFPMQHLYVFVKNAQKKMEYVYMLALGICLQLKRVCECVCAENASCCNTITGQQDERNRTREKREVERKSGQKRSAASEKKHN